MLHFCNLNSEKNPQNPAIHLETLKDTNMLTLISDLDSIELRQLCQTLERFGEKHLSKPGVESNSFSRNDFEELAKLGVTAMSVDEKHGGSPMSNLAVAASIFELARAELGPAIYTSVHLMVAKLINGPAKTEYHFDILRRLSSGTDLGAFCLTEAGAGSDAASLQTSAKKTADGFILNGEKIYITSAGLADVYLVFARNEEDQKISAFVLEKGQTGLSFGKPENKMGCEGAPIANVRFENCKIPEQALLGNLGEGYKIALSGLNSGRINIAAAACGLCSKALHLATEYAQTRKQFKRAIGEFQAIQVMLADMYTKTSGAIELSRRAAQLLDQGDTKSVHASSAKCFATDAAMEITTNGVQILGGAGYIRDYGMEQLMRDAKMLQIVEGSNQIQRILIARELLGKDVVSF